MFPLSRFIGYLAIRSVQSLGADNTVCLAFLAVVSCLYLALYCGGLLLDVIAGSGFLFRIALTSGFSLFYWLQLPGEISEMKAQAKSLQKHIDDTF